MDAAEYNHLVRLWADPLYRFALKCTGEAEDARDAVQGAYAALWESRKTVAVEKGKAFLFQVAYRQSVDRYRRGRRTTLPGELPETAALSTSAGTDLRRQLDRALARLDEQARGLVLLKDYEGYSYEEIGRITGLSDSQVRVYLHRARKKLKEYLVSVEQVI